ncbi:MAG: glycosyltransferase involved in cell wall biosynthesis [Myxococcota bacterium]|jgi:glycosyltransferase involved in cell wall biosynthesis
MYGRMRVAAVVPAYNEERLIERTLTTLPRFVDGIIVVDDGSRDRTVLRAEQVDDARITVVKHRKNRGVGAAIVTGYRHVLASDFDVAVVVGGDAQMDPLEMDRLLEPIAIGAADYVKGDRMSHPELETRMPKNRRIGNQVLTALTRVATGAAEIRDSQCGYTAITRQALEQLPLERVWPRYGYPNDILGWMTRAGLRVVDRPVTPIYGEEVSGIRPLTIVPTLAFVLARVSLDRYLSRGAL